MMYRALLFLAIILIIQGCGGESLTGGKAEEAIEGIDLLAETLDRYFEKYEKYPEKVNELVSDGFLGRFPANPYKKDARMKEVPFTSPDAGDFTFLKVYKGRQTNVVIYFVLILWGPEDLENEDIFDQARDYDNYHFVNWESMSDGEPDRHLKVIKGSMVNQSG